MSGSELIQCKLMHQASAVIKRSILLLDPAYRDHTKAWLIGNNWGASNRGSRYMQLSKIRCNMKLLKISGDALNMRIWVHPLTPAVWEGLS